MTTILVTGATGFLGYHVAKRLNQSGIRPRVLERPGSTLDVLQGLDVDVAGADGVVHPVPLVTQWGLALAPRLLGAARAQALSESAVWTLVPFLALALALGVVARRGRIDSSSQPGN